MAVLMLVKDVGEKLSPASKHLDSGDIGEKFRWYTSSFVNIEKTLHQHNR